VPGVNPNAVAKGIGETARLGAAGVPDADASEGPGDAVLKVKAGAGAADEQLARTSPRLARAASQAPPRLRDGACADGTSVSFLGGTIRRDDPAPARARDVHGRVRPPKYSAPRAASAGPMGPKEQAKGPMSRIGVEP